MKTINPIPAPATSSFNRATILFLINAAIDRKIYRFARQVCSSWLGNFPGDLEVSLNLARVHFADRNFNEAETIIRKVCALDPAYQDAVQLLFEIIKDRGTEEAQIIESSITALRGSPLPEAALDWGLQTWKARQTLQSSDFELGQKIITGVIQQKIPSPIPALVHLQLSASMNDGKMQKTLAEEYLQSWPDCLEIKLQLADALLKAGDETGAVDLLHQCASSDAGGQIPKRLWGERHPYRLLWNDRLEIKLNVPIPADVATLIGWNKLGSGGQLSGKAAGAASPLETGVPEAGEEASSEKISNNSSPADAKNGVLESESSETLAAADIAPDKPAQDEVETLKPVTDAFRRISKKINRPEIGRMDGRFPIYVIFSTKQGLVKQYGQQTAEAIGLEMKKLVQAVQKKPGWGAMVFYPDDIDMALGLGLTAVSTVDPWQLKLALHSLDAALAKKGAMIGALLIVGGPDVVPFHLLPNPTDDSDQDVASDNPYSTLDTNYFVPEWPVGRLPGEAGTDAGLLIDQLRRMISYHKGEKVEIPWWQRIFGLLHTVQKTNKRVKKVLKNGGAMGYSAAAWRRSSVAVFRPLGEAGSVLVSPPDSSGTIDPGLFISAQAGYYNLHGLPDTPEWYGQKDAGDTSDSPDYPVALSVKDLIKNGKAPEIVFSEACYGGHILNKKEEQAITLRFLNIGVKAVVASSCIAYGSVSTPLIGADLLGYLFWKFTQEGMTAGDALVKAKVETVREMTRRQGFLDGEDQKTLISFILYGDPLMSYKDKQVKQKTVVRVKGRPEIKTVSERQVEGEEPVFIPKEVIREVKAAVEQYLPGLDSASITVGQERFSAEDGDFEVRTRKMGRKVKESRFEKGRYVVTFSKEVTSLNHLHHHYARATVDKQGKIVKIALSR